MMICDELMFLIHAVLSTGTHSPSMHSNMHGPYNYTGDLPGMMRWMEPGRWIWNTVYILCIVHVHDVVTDWSYALV